jgi:drug/metabolite transporter (DMT)-like permease
MDTSMSLSIIAALGAALCWAFGGLISHTPAQHLGALAFNRTRLTLVFFMLAMATTLLGTWQTLDSRFSAELLLSGFIGIFIGDTALFSTLRRLGPRRTAIIFAMNAPLTALLAFLFLRERLNLFALLGITLVFTGVALAIIFGKRQQQRHHWEHVKGSLKTGIAIGILAALSQAGGIIIAKPVLDAGADPIAASAIRVGISALAFIALTLFRPKLMAAHTPLDLRIFGMTLLSGFIGMGVGMTLLLLALAHGDAGIVATLSATTPILILPLIWIRTGERPAALAWGGAGLVLIGTALIFNA